MSNPPHKSRIGKMWVPIVILAGVLWGGLTSFLTTIPREERPEAFRVAMYFTPNPLIRLHIIFTAIEVALLISLVVVYVKVYAETKARFSLGLVIVLVALLLQSLFSYPLLLGLVGPVRFRLDFFLFPADLLTTVAYSIFLYLSLE